MADDKTTVAVSTDSAALTPTPAPWGEIHTMPAFTAKAPSGPSQPTPKKPHRRWWVWAVVAVLIIIGGAGTYFTFFASPSTAPGTNQTSETPSPTPPPTPTPNPTPTPTPPTTTPDQRDSQRVSDINSLQGALQAYAADHGGKYPVAVLPQVLGSDTSRTLSSAGFGAQAQGTLYLATVPQNPMPNGADYLYDSVDGSTYTITFRLEAGSGTLAAGDHQAAPGGIDIGSPGTNPAAAPLKVTPPPATVDTDHDGLTDAEEPLFGADPYRPDTDSDGYPDGQEVKTGYDPAVGHSAKLSDSAFLATYINTKFGYTVKYPKAWTAKANNQDSPDEVIFSDANNPSEFIEILVTDNPDNLSAAAWYAKNAPQSGVTAEQVPTLTVGSTTWALSPDGLNAYTTSGNSLITVSYNIGTHTEASYLEVFQTMVQLFQLTNAPVTASPNTNAPAPVNNNTNAPAGSGY